VADMSTSKEMNQDDLSIVENILQKLYELFNTQPSEVKVGDILKVIELKHKLIVTGHAERKFWSMIEQVRQEQLNSGPSAKVSLRKRKGVPKETKVS
jgi:hypothetical protein